MTDIFRFIRFFVSVASGQAADAVAARNLLSDAISLVPKESVWVGTTDTAMYYPRLAGKRVALLANHTSMIGERHLDPVALRREHAEAFRRGDALVRGGVNRLDAGVLYLNYIERLDACVGFEREAIGPDRPNLNRMLIDGPILEERYEAGGGICVPDDCRGICCGGDPQPVAGGYRVVPYSKKAISFIRRATFIPFYS